MLKKIEYAPKQSRKKTSLMKWNEMNSSISTLKMVMPPETIVSFRKGAHGAICMTLILIGGLLKSRLERRIHYDKNG